MEVYITCCTVEKSWKSLVPEICVKMFLGNRISGLLNKLYLQNEKMKKPDFLHGVTNSLKLKVE